jgi:hypothetical protein
MTDKEENIMRIKMAKDRGRTVIAIDGAAEGLDKAIFALVSDFCAGGDGREFCGEVPVLGLAPPPKDEEKFSEEDVAVMEPYTPSGAHEAPAADGGTKGDDPLDALRKGREKALSELFERAKVLPDCPEKKDILRACRNYLTRDLPVQAEETAGREDRVSFLLAVSGMIGRGLATSYGFRDMKELCRNGSDDEIEDAFKTATDSLVKRGERIAA